jgi:hypothetical protein
MLCQAAQLEILVEIFFAMVSVMLVNPLSSSIPPSLPGVAPSDAGCALGGGGSGESLAEGASFGPASEGVSGGCVINCEDVFLF